MNHRWLKVYKFAISLFISVFLITSCSSVRSVQINRAKKHYNKGQILASRGETDRALKHFNKSINISRAAEFKSGVANNLNELAIIHTERGEFAKARELLAEMIEIYKKINMKPEVSKSMSNMAMTYIREKNFQEGFKWFDELIEWDKKTGNELGIGITLYNKALIYHRHLGMDKEAKECLFKALKIFKETGNEDYIRMIQKNMQKE